MSDEESMTAMLAKIRKRAEEEKKNADRKPTTVQEAQEFNQNLEQNRERLRANMETLKSIDLDEKFNQEFQGTLNSVEQAFSSINMGIERSKTVIEASRVVPLRKKKIIQVAFLMDSTGSMSCGDIITNVKNTISQLCKYLGSISSLDTAVGFVAYRDYTNEDKRFEICDFTSDINVFVSKLSKVEAIGGDDEAEDVLGGFDQVINKMSWGPLTETIHVVVFTGDSPGHGLWDKKTQDIGDNYPDGDKYGLTVEKTCAKLLQLGITLAFLKVNSKTDYMIDLFNREMTNGGMSVIQEQYQDVNSCRKSIERLLTLASSVSCTTGRIVEKIIKREIPKKTKVNVETAKIRGTLMVQQSIELSAVSALKVAMDILRAKTVNELNLRESNQTEMTIEIPWFSCGGIRFAHVAQFSREKVVAKDFQWGNDNLTRHLDEFRSTLISSALAFLFCSKLGIRPEKFRYVQTQIFSSKENLDNPHLSKFYSVEKFVEGEFTKFNSNGGYVNPAFEMAQAFSHFSYHVCDGKLMVLDLQGWFEESSKDYLLTDPAIVTEDYNLLPTATNLGKGAMHDFLKVHKCGSLCAVLGNPKIV